VIDPETLAACEGFDWNDANAGKILRKHGVTPEECEQVFGNAPLVVADDPRHSHQERRHFALGHTATGRVLFLVFTLRRNSIRVISARSASRKERKEYGAT
jgi:uncharacterized DUF497 family protein